MSTKNMADSLRMSIAAEESQINKKSIGNLTHNNHMKKMSQSELVNKSTILQQTIACALRNVELISSAYLDSLCVANKSYYKYLGKVLTSSPSGYFYRQNYLHLFQNCMRYFN